jgi:hypothetical protein
MRSGLFLAFVTAGVCLVGQPATAGQRQAAPPPAAQGGKYVVCQVSASTGQYFTEAFAVPATVSDQDRVTWEVAFGKYVLQKYGVSAGGGCLVYQSQTLAEAAIKRSRDSAGQAKVVFTDWTPATAAATAEPAPSGMYGICYSDGGQSTVYYSGDIHVDFQSAPQTERSAQDPRVVELANRTRQQFLAYLQKTYGYKPASAYPATCQYNMRYKSEVTALKDRFTTRFPQDKFVETGWLPGTESATAAPPQAAVPAAAAPSSAASIAGVYAGSYICGGRTRSLKLELSAPDSTGLVTGHFTAYQPPESHDKPYTFLANGRLDPATGKFKLMPLKWETRAPPNMMMVGLTGTFDAKANKVTGTIDFTGCTTFEVRRGGDD